MTAAQPPWVAELLYVWFEKLVPTNWFSQSDEIDAMLYARFAGTLNAMRTRPETDFMSDAGRALAAILLFDQIPRNIYRDTPLAFKFDGKALALSHAAIATGFDRTMSNDRRQFVAMPMMHSERLADQTLSVRYFGAHLPDNLSFARSHHKMIARFGRFPHRNAVLGRETTAAEQKAIDEGYSW